ncbi:hypothetical protein BSKO_05667 [Bryopsis sp. KO-2023]|nr:hypothetical protein BSKO_05667 [Bryopsis sp. KO-2023]
MSSHETASNRSACDYWPDVEPWVFECPETSISHNPRCRQRKPKKNSSNPRFGALGPTQRCEEGQPRGLVVCTEDPKRRDQPGKSVYELLDAVPFTPTMGVCTPSPTNWAVNKMGPFGPPPGSPTSTGSGHGWYLPSHYSTSHDAGSPVQRFSGSPGSPLGQHYPMYIPYYCGSNQVGHDASNSNFQWTAQRYAKDSRESPPRYNSPPRKSSPLRAISSEEAKPQTQQHLGDIIATSIDKKVKGKAQQCPEVGPAGELRLNARQRRTLRRAQERLMAALGRATEKAFARHSSAPSEPVSSVSDNCEFSASKF